MSNPILELDTNPHEEGSQLYDNWDTRNTAYKEQAIELLKEYNFHKQTIDALTPYILNYMSSNAFMSNLTPPKGKATMILTGTPPNPLAYANLSHSESALKLFAAIHPCDKNKPVLYVLLDNIFKHTEIFTFSRVQGNERVGVTNRVIQTKTTQEIKQSEIQKEQEDIKKGGPF